MKHSFKHICCLMLLGIVAAGCSSDDAAAIADGEGGVGELTDSYVTLNFTMAFAGQGTRFNPTGGEEGDGTEAGQETDGTNENEITSAVAFLYQDGAGVNGDAATPVTPVYFGTVHDAGNSSYKTDPQQVTLPNGNYHILVVANPGADWWTNPAGPLNLGNVRDHLQETAWTETDGKYSDFLMSSATDGGEFTLASQPESAPLNINVNVERMAARIDYLPVGTITCDDNTGEIDILGAAIVNDYNAGSYLMKRVADEVDGTTLDYLGDEVAGLNYVIDPKTKEGKASTDYKEDTYYPDIIDKANGYADPDVWDGFVQEGTEITADDGTKWKRIGYTMENTTPTTADIQSTNTGVVFKARFTPAGGTVEGNYDYSGHATFFSYRGVLYASMEDVMKAFYGEEAFNSFDAKINACVAWTDVQTFIDENLNSLDPSGYYGYLTEKVKQGGQFSPAGLFWTKFMSDTYGYTNTVASGGTANVSLVKGYHAREKLRPYGVSTYKDATCYYTWWVKHSNDGDDTTVGPMEYAIVRNNIYKLTVKSVAGLGGDVPGGTPESGDDIVIHVKVNDWMLLDEEEIIM